MTNELSGLKLSVKLLLLTLGAHARSFNYRVSVVVPCVSLCVCVRSNLPPHTLESQKRETNGFIAIQELFKVFADFAENASFQSYGSPRAAPAT